MRRGPLPVLNGVQEKESSEIRVPSVAMALDIDTSVKASQVVTKSPALSTLKSSDELAAFCEHPVVSTQEATFRLSAWR